MRNFLNGDAGGGFVLLAAAMLAIFFANSAFSGTYDLVLGAQVLELDLRFWVNDFLMAFFFLIAGMEIKREIVAGSLSSWQRAGLPFLVAIGGMAIPAFIYLFFARDGFSQGWAVPAATDIAFALGIYALVGKHLPPSLRALLLAVAVIDDLGAILIIAAFYTESIGVGYLLAGLVCFAGLVGLNRAGVVRYSPYFALGGLLWWLCLKSGVHPTMAGVLMGLCIPMYTKGFSPLEVLKERMHFYVVYLVLPLFALVNAGVSFQGLKVTDMLHPVTLGIGAGLFLGKQLGIFGTLYAAIKSPYFLMPDKASFGHLYGVSLLCGIGFTMALFIGNLAFVSEDMAVYVRMGVISGSLLSAVGGYAVLRYLANRPLKESYE